MRFFAIIVILGAMLTACSSETPSANNAPPPIPVHIADVVQQDVPLYFESLGTLQPSVLVEVRPQVSGMLQEIHFTDGQSVKKGDRLFTIDPQSYSIRLHEMEAIYLQNKASLDIAQKKLARFSSLSKKDLIPQQEWDELQALVARGEAQILGDEARVETAKLDLEHCSIKAPISGKAGKAAIDSGNLVLDRQPKALVTLSNIDKLSVAFTLTEREFQQLTPEHKQGNYPFEVCTFCNSTEISKGTLTFLDHSFDGQTGLLQLQGELSNKSGKFLPGQYVRVRIPIQVIQNAKVVPQKSVKINQAGPYVYVVKEDNSVELRKVQLGEEIDGKVVVSDGLNPGEKVVTDGHLRLSPGLKVEIKTEEGHS